MNQQKARERFEEWLKESGYAVLGGNMRIVAESAYIAGMEEAAPEMRDCLVNLYHLVMREYPSLADQDEMKAAHEIMVASANRERAKG